jgi:hypothetical protein
VFSQWAAVCGVEQKQQNINWLFDGPGNRFVGFKILNTGMAGKVCFIKVL